MKLRTAKKRRARLERALRAYVKRIKGWHDYYEARVRRYAMSAFT